MHASRSANDLQLQLGQDSLRAAVVQALRCRVSVAAPGAPADPAARRAGCDAAAFAAVADHLVVIDRRPAPADRGCDRLPDRCLRHLACRAQHAVAA